MLNGLYPIMIFNFSKLAPDLQASLSDIPIVSSIVNKIGFPPIPVYLDEAFTGLVIDTEEKSVEIQTNTETTTNGSDPVTNQKGLASTIRVAMKCDKGSTGLTLLSALSDRIFEKVTSKEYSISYFSGAVTIYEGLLNSFNITQNANDSLYQITFELSRTTNKLVKPGGPPLVQKITGAVPL